MPRQKKQKGRVDAENVLYITGLIAGFSAVYFLLGTKFGMPNPLKPRGQESRSLFEILMDRRGRDSDGTLK
jgi:hypothetical protein